MRVIIICPDGSRESGKYLGVPPGHLFARVKLDDGGYQSIIPGFKVFKE